MYKELSDCLKKYSPLESELSQIESAFLSHSFIHSGGNLYGEKYEGWVYEYLKSWALSCDDVSSYILKLKPNDSSSINSDGLNYDKNGQIIFLKNGKKLAEYDGLFIFKGKIVFVESSVSELRSYFRNLEERLIKKRLLLTEHFNTEDVYYLVVTRPRKRSLVYRSLPNLILYKLKDPDFSIMDSSRASVESIDSLNPKLVDLKSISSSLFSS